MNPDKFHFSPRAAAILMAWEMSGKNVYVQLLDGHFFLCTLCGLRREVTGEISKK